MCAKNQDKSVLHVCLDKSRKMTDLIEYAADSIVSKTVLDKPAGIVTLFAFDAGQKLSEHTAPYDAIVQVIEGTAHIIIDGQAKRVVAGEIIIMPAGVPHAVAAEEKFKMQLTMVRA